MNALLEKVLNVKIESGDIEACSEYGEDGYILEDGKKAILFANWNEFDKYPNFMEWVEANYEIEWSDEWIISHEHGKAYRSSPDSYGWQQQFRITEDGEIITPDDDAEVWINHCKIEDSESPHTPNALPYFISQEDIEAEGFKLLDDDLESGWYGRNDNPMEIAEEIIEEGKYKEVVFSLNAVGQFAIQFSTYGR